MAASSVRRASIETVASGVVAQGVLMASGILVARLLGVENRGHLALMLLFPLILSISGTFGLHTAVTYYAAQGHDVRALLRLVRPTAVRQFVVCLVIDVIVLALVFGDEPASVKVAAALSIIGLPALFMINWAQAALQGEHRFRAYNVSRLAAPVLYSSGLVAIFALDVDDFAVVATVLAVTMLAGCAYAFVHAVRHASSSGKPPPPLSEMKRFGLKGMVGWVSPLESFQLDQLFIGLALSPTDLGLYVVAAAFTNLTRLFIPQSLGVIAYPHVAAKESRAEARTAVWRFFLLAFAACAIAIAILEVAIGTLIPLFFGDEFEDAVPLAHILLVGSLFLGLRRVLTDGTRGAGEPTLGTIAEGVTAVVAIPSLIVAGSEWGPEGVAWAISASYAVGLVAMIAMTVIVLARPARGGGGPPGASIDVAPPEAEGATA